MIGFETTLFIKPPPLAGVSDVRRACAATWRWKSSAQPDAGEGLAKRKGIYREMVSGGSVEQRREPMNKNRIAGVWGGTSGRETAKSISIKSNKR